MSVIRTIVKRELASYFSSPVAYVFLVHLLLLTGFFTFTGRQLLQRGEASLAASSAGIRGSTWCSCGGRYAVWPRSAARERLSSFSPCRCAVAGDHRKFLASWIFLAVALALTFPASLR